MTMFGGLCRSYFNRLRAAERARELELRQRVLVDLVLQIIIFDDEDFAPLHRVQTVNKLASSAASR